MTTDLSVAEAFAAVLVAAVASDGSLGIGESARLEGVLTTCRVLPPNPADGGPNVVERALAHLTEYGVPAVLAEAARVLPGALRAAAFAQAVDLVFADGRLADRERSFVEDLQRILQVDGELATKIVQVLLIKNAA
jgi:hypothetical protein